MPSVLLFWPHTAACAQAACTLALSRKANRPVKLVMTRVEVFRASGPTSATSIDVKIGIKKDGTITAGSAELRYASGPYLSMWAELGAMTSFACYDLKNVRTRGYEVLVNRPKSAAYRAPSAPMAAFAVESVVDELAHKIGMDASDTAQLFFDNVRVPQRNLIGQEGMGFMFQMLQFQEERLWGAASSLRSLDNMIDATIEYTRQRKAFGKSILDNQVVHYRLAELRTEVAALREEVAGLKAKKAAKAPARKTARESS